MLLENIIIFSLIAFCSIAYVIGGESREKIRWAHTLFRDIGCSLCIFTLAWILFLWS